MVEYGRLAWLRLDFIMVNIYVDADAGLGKDEFENFLSFGNASLRREAD